MINECKYLVPPGTLHTIRKPLTLQLDARQYINQPEIAIKELNFFIISIPPDEELCINAKLASSIILQLFAGSLGRKEILGISLVSILSMMILGYCKRMTFCLYFCDY